MTASLHIAPGLALPLDLVTNTAAILGVRGSGKTNTAVCIVEELLSASQQTVIIDPVDVWWGLKSSQDGKHAGFEIPIVGGEHGDVPLEGSGGVVIADFIVDSRASAVISIRHLSMNDQRRFAADFARRLYERKGPAEFRSPMMLVVDEADEFMPQRIPSGHESMFGSFDRIVRRGRASGIGMIAITQRPQVINKDVLSQMETLIAHRVLHKLDRKALEAWIEAHDTENRAEEFMASLASLERGDAWIWSPVLRVSNGTGIFRRVHIRARRTFDSSATPSAGHRIAPPQKTALVDLDRLREKLSATIEKQKADDPRELRKQLHAAHQEIAELRWAAPAKADPERLKKEFYRGADSVRRELAADLRKYERQAGSLYELAVTALENAAARLEQFKSAERPKIPSIDAIIERVKTEPQPREDVQRAASTADSLRRSTTSAGPRPSHPPVSNDAGILPTGERAILTACAQHGDRGCAREQITVLTGYKRSSRDTYIQRLSSKGLIAALQGGSIVATDAGIASLGPDFEPLPTGRDLAAWWLARLTGGEQKILGLLLSAGSEGLDRAAISEQTGYQRSSRDTYIQRLSARKLADVSTPGIVRAASELFE